MMDDAHTLLASNGYNSAMNRLYYACFYAAEGLLLANHIEAQTHNGVKMQLSMLFFRTGKLPIEHAHTYYTLFEKRQSGDYSDYVYYDATIVEQYLPKAEAFVKAIESEAMPDME